MSNQIQKFHVGDKVVYNPTNQVYLVKHVTPEVNALPSTDRMYHILALQGNRELMAVPLAIADEMLRPTTAIHADTPVASNDRDTAE